MGQRCWLPSPTTGNPVAAGLYWGVQPRVSCAQSMVHPGALCTWWDIGMEMLELQEHNQFIPDLHLQAVEGGRSPRGGCSGRRGMLQLRGEKTELLSHRQPQHKPHRCRSVQGWKGLKRSPLPHQGLLGQILHRENIQ